MATIYVNDQVHGSGLIVPGITWITGIGKYTAGIHTYRVIISCTDSNEGVTCPENWSVSEPSQGSKSFFVQDAPVTNTENILGSVDVSRITHLARSER